MRTLARFSGAAHSWTLLKRPEPPSEPPVVNYLGMFKEYMRNIWDEIPKHLGVLEGALGELTVM
jgi:hypothetical protein